MLICSNQKYTKVVWTHDFSLQDLFTSRFLLVLSREFSGMIHNNDQESSQQPPATHPFPAFSTSKGSQGPMGSVARDEKTATATTMEIPPRP